MSLLGVVKRSRRFSSTIRTMGHAGKKTTTHAARSLTPLAPADPVVCYLGFRRAAVNPVSL